MSESRFEFGKNWKQFLNHLNIERIQEAENSLRAKLQVSDLQDKRFLDIGSGSGLFSLAARRLGASVYSFDYDAQSVACTTELRRRYFPDDPNWIIQQGSALDIDYLQSLGTFDVVYSWGVLHHTGEMWQALDNIISLVEHGGQLFISIYNDQGWQSKAWLRIKRTYINHTFPIRHIVLWVAFLRLWGPTFIRDTLRGDPAKSWRGYYHNRGMSAWTDVIDWVGGYPFEVAKPEEIFSFYRSRGFILENMTTVGGKLGCNEYILRHKSS